MSKPYAFLRHKLLDFPKLAAAERHGQGLDQTSKRRRRLNAVERCLSICGDGEAKIGGEHFQLKRAFAEHKKKHGAREHPNGRPVLHLIVGVSPSWVKEGGDPHDPDNPRNRLLVDATRRFAEQEYGGVFAARLDIDEHGSSIVDVFCAPVREMRLGGRKKKDGTPRKTRKVVSPNRALDEITVRWKRPKGQRFHAGQDAWAAFAKENLDPDFQRGKPRSETKKAHLSPEEYGAAREQEKEAERQRQAAHRSADAAERERKRADERAQRAEAQRRDEERRTAAMKAEREAEEDRRDLAAAQRREAEAKRREAEEQRDAALVQMREAQDAAKRFEQTLAQMREAQGEIAAEREAARKERAEAKRLLNAAARQREESLAEARRESAALIQRAKDHQAEAIARVNRWQEAREYKAVVNQNTRLRGLVAALYEDVGLINRRSMAVAELLDINRPDHRTALERMGEAIQRAVKRLNPWRKMIERIRKIRRAPAC